MISILANNILEPKFCEYKSLTIVYLFLTSINHIHGNKRGTFFQTSNPGPANLFGDFEKGFFG